MMKKDFETPDVYLAAALSLLLQKEPTFRVVHNRTLFMFPISDEFFQAMSNYNGGIELDAYQYAQKIKRLRAEMLMRRSGEVRR